jgi:hypothetical protein
MVAEAEVGGIEVVVMPASPCPLTKNRPPHQGRGTFAARSSFQPKPARSIQALSDLN